MKVIIIGGIAAGTSAGAKLKRISPDTEVVIYEKSDIVSFGACGLPYFVANYFEESNKMIARTPEAFEKSGVKVKTKHEVVDVNFDDKFIVVRDLSNGKNFKEYYDKLM
ncbi:FAD-dependent oxidoreductase, partial [Clostridium cadaveris]